MDKRKVMVVDDQKASRHMFELYIASSEKYELAFSVASAAVADIYLLKNHVDLILMDILMNDGSNGLDAAEKIKKQYPGIKIIAVTSMPEYSWMKRARSIGVDSSPDMLQIASEKGRDGILYLQQDMREFELYGTVRAVVSVCDSLNYVTDEEDLFTVFRLVCNYLDPGGWFFFDMNTLWKYRNLLGDAVFAEIRHAEVAE